LKVPEFSIFLHAIPCSKCFLQG
jgi:hypothetical protein